MEQTYDSNSYEFAKLSGFPKVLQYSIAVRQLLACSTSEYWPVLCVDRHTLMYRAILYQCWALLRLGRFTDAVESGARVDEWVAPR